MSSHGTGFRAAGPAHYNTAAIALHGLLAVLLAVLPAVLPAASFSVGSYLHELPLSPSRLKLYSGHTWAGIAILLLSLIRLAWNSGQPFTRRSRSTRPRRPCWRYLYKVCGSHSPICGKV